MYYANSLYEVNTQGCRLIKKKIVWMIFKLSEITVNYKINYITENKKSKPLIFYCQMYC